MFSPNLSLMAVHDCLQAMQPLELLGMQLLQNHTPTVLMPTGIAREQLVAAVTELVDYSGRCASALRQLSDLAAIPLLTVPTLEYGL